MSRNTIELNSLEIKFEELVERLINEGLNEEQALIEASLMMEEE